MINMQVPPSKKLIQKTVALISRKWPALKEVICTYKNAMPCGDIGKYESSSFIIVIVIYTNRHMLELVYVRNVQVSV